MTPDASDVLGAGNATDSSGGGYTSGGYLEAFERAALMLAAIVIAISAIVLPPQAAYSVTVGAALAALNATMIHRIGGRIARTAKSPALLVVVFQVKLFVLLGLIFVAMRYFGVEGVPLAFGISVLPVSLFLAGLFRPKSRSTSTTFPKEDIHG